MAPSLATYFTSDGSDDDNAVPESITLVQSKEQAKWMSEAQEAAESIARRRTKDKNRRRDENLKKRAQETRAANGTQAEIVANLKGSEGKNKTSKSGIRNAETRNLAERMDRAMREADEEDEADEETWEGFGSNSDVEDDIVAGRDSDDSSEDGNKSVSKDDDASMKENVQVQRNPKVDYLPDHLFSEALAKSRIPSRQSVSLTKPSIKTKSKHKSVPARKSSAKDIILGSKTIRSLSPKAKYVSSTASRTLPPGKVKRFYEDRLNLLSIRTGKSHRNWDRKAANIGILRNSTLPAASFVRNS